MRSLENDPEQNPAGSINQSFNMMQDNFRYYLCDGQELANSIKIVICMAGTLLRHLDDQPFLSFTVKDLRFLAFTDKLRTTLQRLQELQ